MEQRPLRLGDIVDDYCPRERRITNHAIVALVGQGIRQTRCTTCDAEHVYKEAKVPRRKKSDAPAAQDDQVLVDAGPAQLVPARNDGDLAAPAIAAAASGSDDPVVSAPSEHDRQASANGSAGEPEPAEPRTEDLWAAHRPLIRATLPRTENDPPTPRPIPEFTMHQRRTRGAHMFRQGGWQGQGNGNVRHNGFRHGRSGPGQGGQNPGNHGNHGNGPGPNRHESGGRSGRRHGSKNKRPR